MPPTSRRSRTARYDDSDSVSSSEREDASFAPPGTRPRKRKSSGSRATTSRGRRRKSAQAEDGDGDFDFAASQPTRRSARTAAQDDYGYGAMFDISPGRKEEKGEMYGYAAARAARERRLGGAYNVSSSSDEGGGDKRKGLGGARKSSPMVMGSVEIKVPSVVGSGRKGGRKSDTAAAGIGGSGTIATATPAKTEKRTTRLSTARYGSDSDSDFGGFRYGGGDGMFFYNF
ncbi:hypothetical protein AAP_05118 [Ascosphaera apis ARSEF 7405]|uniref:Uncharacterized protein n=1 Tax=Ascosphaera apis ARSEF 7405 TaxID=392613 RepID=A0A167W1K3_9EURO|nr:hypothetical protein AAP_05118 [Ascosphaera apis ARSEF 7405]